MGEVVEHRRVVEPTEWFVVFHRTSTSRILSFLAFGEFKHVSAFAYAPGFKCWLMYDVQWRGTAVTVADQAAVIGLTRGCTILKMPRTSDRMRMTARAGFYCVTAIKHLLRLRCVAVTPDALYRHILHNGGIMVSEHRCTSASTDPG